VRLSIKFIAKDFSQIYANLNTDSRRKMDDCINLRELANLNREDQREQIMYISKNKTEQNTSCQK